MKPVPAVYQELRTAKIGQVDVHLLIEEYAGLPVEMDVAQPAGKTQIIPYQVYVPVDIGRQGHRLPEAGLAQP